MDKRDFVDTLKTHRKRLSDLMTRCQAAKSKQVRVKAILNYMEDLATEWFEDLEQVLLSDFGLPEDTIDQYRNGYVHLLELADAHPSTATIVGILQQLQRKFHGELIVPVIRRSETLLRYPSLDRLLSHAQNSERNYLEEAIDCARSGKRRAAIILGWCAAVDRLQRRVESEGFTKLNQASVQMAAITAGRYKRFTKKYAIQNLSDLRMTVFDGDLLWVLEFMGLIDGNQHERLEICFTMRNTVAHPGEAAMSDENVLSFFSDIDSLILDNPKFKVVPISS